MAISDSAQEQPLLSNDTSGANPFSPLSDQELPFLFDRLVDIVSFICDIWLIVVGDIVNLVFFQEFGSHNPGAIRDDFINPFAMPHRLGTLSASQDR